MAEVAMEAPPGLTLVQAATATVEAVQCSTGRRMMQASCHKTVHPQAAAAETEAVKTL